VDPTESYLSGAARDIRDIRDETVADEVQPRVCSILLVGHNRQKAQQIKLNQGKSRQIKRKNFVLRG